MISYADFEFAIARWKTRAGGAPQPVQPAASGMVEAEVPVATAPESPVDEESGAVMGEVQGVVSGTLMVNDGSEQTSLPESEDEYQK